VANTIPSEVKIPIAGPVLLIASMAYSTYIKRPSVVKVVVLESYFLDIILDLLNY